MPNHDAMTTDSTSARLLIVDDEVAQMKALCNTLKDQGFNTTGFASSKAALAHLREQKFDLLLTDMMMPEMDGITLLRSALELDPSLIVIIMTGEGTISTAVESMKSGAFDYMLKPFKLSVLLPVVARALAVRQLRARNAELEASVRQHTLDLEAANKELESFSYSVSHDLRSPLRHIEGFAKLLKLNHADQLPEEAQEFIERITYSTGRMGILIDDLLKFSRLGRQHLSRGDVNVSALVAEVLEELKKDQGDRPLDIRVGPLPNCSGDWSLLRQVYINLLSNAFKFTRGKNPAVIEVGFEEKAGERIYFVRDNGAGFDMKDAQKLFGVFQRLHAQTEFDGTGVGLSIVQRIIQRHGGRIWADAAPGEGATFHFTIPG
ncbi:MAG TPA: response regulator [Verrucomicrobiae bacterium]|jgi:hypothetical protein|nr:response regulator [Verrucomicrobiae bacterium]